MESQIGFEKRNDVKAEAEFSYWIKSTHLANLDKVTFDKWIGEDINNGFKMLTGLDDESLEIKRGNELDKLYSLTKDERKDNLVEELNLIQTQIQRMAGNSFIVKGWYTTFMSAFIVYIFTKNDFSLIFLGVILTLGCFIYDCYFLYLENRYREKYSWVINNIDNDNFLFNLDPYEEEMLNKPVLWKDILLSKSSQLKAWLSPLAP